MDSCAKRMIFAKRTGVESRVSFSGYNICSHVKDI